MKDTRIRLSPSPDLRKWIARKAKTLGLSEADYVLRLVVDARQAEAERVVPLKKVA